MTAMLPFPSIDSMDTLLDFLSANGIDDYKIYEHLCPQPPKNVSHIIRALDRVTRASFKARPAGTEPHGRRPNKNSFRSYQSTLKGKLFERLATELISSVKCFTTYSNLPSATNELDILVTLGNSSSWVRAMQNWGTHFICECKFHDTHITNTWVGKLNTVLLTHGATVGLLISKKGIAPIGRGTQIRHQLQLLAVATPSHFIIPLSFEDLLRCAAGENLLALISKKYVEVRTGVANFAALVGH